MKRRWFSFLLVFILVVSSGCSKSDDKDIYSKATTLMFKGDYESAITALNKIVEQDEFDIKARDLIAEAYIAKEAYSDADAYLSSYYDFVVANLDNSSIRLTKAIDSLGDYGRDILRAGEKVGDWYNDVKPSKLSLDTIETVYTQGDTLTLNVPKGAEVYYTLDYTSPLTDGILYSNSIPFDEEGYFELAVVVKSKFGEYSPVTTAYIDVTSGDYTETTDTESDIEDPSDLVAVTVDLADGTYNEPQTLHVTNYSSDSERYQILYTLNGTDPSSSNNSRYFYDSVPLYVGQYDFTFCVYDNESGNYSDLTYANIYINNPESIKIGIYGLPESTVEEYRYLFEQAYWDEFYPELVVIDDINNLNPLNLPDALITYDYYAEDLAALGAISNIDLYFDLSQYDIIANATDAAKFAGVNYMLPITIRPEFMVYGDYSNAGNVTWESLKEASSWYENKFMYSADRPEMLLGIYYGLGGQPLDTEYGNIKLDKTILTEALKIVSSMPKEGLGSRLYSSEDVSEAISGYTVESILYDDSIVRNGNNLYSYTPIGAMPLPNGNHAKYYNVVTGMMISNVWVDENKVAQLQKFYDYVYNSEYYLPYVAQSEGSLPVFKKYINDNSIYYTMDINAYEAIIEEGVSKIRSYALYSLYEAMSTPLYNLVTGSSPEEVATQIMEAIGQ